MKHIKTLKIDIDKKNFEVIPSVQYDSNTRFLHIQLLNNSVPFDITGCSVILSGTKEDGNSIFNSCDVINSEIGFIEAEITEQMNAIPGHIDCEIKIYNGEGVLTSKKFTIKVTPTQTSRAVVSSNEFKALTDALNKAQSIDNKADKKQVEELTSQLDTKANKNEIFTMANMGQDIKEAMTGGSVAVVGKDAILNENIVKNQITSDKIDKRSFGHKYYVDKTSAYPGIAFTVLNAPNATSVKVKFKCNLTAYNGANFLIKHNYGGSYQEVGMSNPVLNEEQGYEVQFSATNSRKVTAIAFFGNTNNSTAKFTGYVYDVQLFLDGVEHSDFTVNINDDITDLTEDYAILASKTHVAESVLGCKKYTDERIKKFGDEFGLSDEAVKPEHLHPTLFETKIKVDKVGAYPGIVFDNLKIPVNSKIELVFESHGYTGGLQAVVNTGFSYNDVNVVTTQIREGVASYRGVVSYPSATTVTRIEFRINSNNPSTTLKTTFVNPYVIVDDTTKIYLYEGLVESEGVELLQKENEKIATLDYVKETVENFKDTFTLENESVKREYLDNLIFGSKIKVDKVGAYPGIVFDGLEIPVNSKIEVHCESHGYTGELLATVNRGFSYNDIGLFKTQLSRKVYAHKGSLTYSSPETVTRVTICIGNNNPSTSLNTILADAHLVVDGVKVDLLNNLVINEGVEVIDSSNKFLASKEYVRETIDTVLMGNDKTDFTLPFVNNLYVVQGSERKHSVPIFIDYLYNGQTNKILFENGEDRTYIGETVVRPDTQSKNILNTKTTLKFKSDAYNVKDVTFNKISIEEKVPNGDIRLLIIGDSVTAGAITEKQYWAVASELFALEDIDRKRTSKVMFLGSNNVRNTTINYNGVEKQVKSCACGISSWSLRHWLTNSSSHFVYDNNGTPVFSILKWLERYRTHLDDGTKLELGDSRLGTKITSSNIDNIQCCTPNIVYINSTHNGGSIEEHEQMIEIIRREIPNCKIIVGNPMPLTGTWHKEKYVGIDWLDNDNITGPNYSWGGGYGTDRIASLNYYIEKERTTDWFYFMPQCVTMPTVESLEYELVDCGIKQMRQVTKVNQLPKEHPGTLTHKIWGYELYALLKYISGVEQGVTNNFDTVPLFD